MRIALASDHRGTEVTAKLAAHLRGAGHEVSLLGDTSGAPCDYPDQARLVGDAVAGGRAERGILICGSGIGMSIAANKVAGIRAALCGDETAAEMTRRHNDANVLCLAADRLDSAAIDRIADVFLATEFEGGRHARRVEKIAAMENAPSSCH